MHAIKCRAARLCPKPSPTRARKHPGSVDSRSVRGIQACEDTTNQPSCRRWSSSCKDPKYCTILALPIAVGRGHSGFPSQAFFPQEEPGVQGCSGGRQGGGPCHRCGCGSGSRGGQHPGPAEADRQGACGPGNQHTLGQPQPPQKGIQILAAPPGLWKWAGRSGGGGASLPAEVIDQGGSLWIHSGGQFEYAVNPWGEGGGKGRGGGSGS